MPTKKYKKGKMYALLFKKGSKVTAFYEKDQNVRSG